MYVSINFSTKQRKFWFMVSLTHCSCYKRTAKRNDLNQMSNYCFVLPSEISLSLIRKNGNYGCGGSGGGGCDDLSDRGSDAFFGNGCSGDDYRDDGQY